MKVVYLVESLTEGVPSSRKTVFAGSLKNAVVKAEDSGLAVNNIYQMFFPRVVGKRGRIILVDTINNGA